MHKAHIAVDPNTLQQRIQTCTAHSRAAAELTKECLECCGLGEAGYLSGLLHDCGKFTEEFDAYLEKSVAGESVKRGSVIHTFAAVRYLLEHFHTSVGKLKEADLSAELLAVSIGGHHGLIDLWDEHHQNGFDHRLTRQPEYDHRAIASFHAECADEEEIQRLFEKAHTEIFKFYQNKLIPSVKSSAEAFFALGLMARLMTSAVVDADRTDTRCFQQNLPHPKVQPPSWEECAAQVNAYVAGFPLDTAIQRARRAFSDFCEASAQRAPGLYRLDLPTGGGKTLAALRFAVLHAEKNGMRRIIYTAPLLSIIDQNAKVIRAAVKDSVCVLEHHSNVLEDKAAPEELAQTELLQETWDAQIIITTFVQLLNTLFSGKMSSVRRFQSLCNSVIIIDEVQSLPPKMLSMFNIAVNFLTTCCGTTVLLCSATQPAFDAAMRQMRLCERLIDENTFRRYEPLFRRTVIRDDGQSTLPEIAVHAAEMLQTSDSLLIVCNTKREAAEMVEVLNGATDAKVFHLSAGMCMAHRERTLGALNEALEKKEKLVCVSTQLIEAGVDVSFGAVIRLAAGLDNIVQAAGRCNRHGEHEEPQSVSVVHLKNEKLGLLAEIRAAQDALNILLADYHRDPDRYSHDLTSDAAIQRYYTALYWAMARGAQDYATHGQTLFELLSTNTQFASEDASSYFLRQAFRTAGEWFEVFDSNQESVLVPYREGAELIERLARPQAAYDMAYAQLLLQKAASYTVSLATNRIEQMEKRGMIYTLLHGSLYVLNQEYYDNLLGIKEGNDSCSTLIL